VVEPERQPTYRQLASDMTHACYSMYRASPLGLAPDTVDVDPATGVMTPHFLIYLQRPEVAESLFYMYRLTGDGKYREQAWEIFQAIEKHTKMAVGYSGLHNAMEVPPSPDDLQQSWFLSETLKYLWLIFSPPSALPLNEWVLNTEAHPLRVAATPARAGALVARLPELYCYHWRT
jgi:mannosyl-oligosaccharide alpha-1,2-mannosidase